MRQDVLVHQSHVVCTRSNTAIHSFCHYLKSKGFHWPLALVCCFLRLFQFLQCSCQPLLSPIQFLLHQLNPAVQTRHITLSLTTKKVTYIQLYTNINVACNNVLIFFTSVGIRKMTACHFRLFFFFAQKHNLLRQKKTFLHPYDHHHPLWFKQRLASEWAQWCLCDISLL